MRLILGTELETHPYDTFGSFIKFYRAFLDQHRPLFDFYCDYSSEILPNSLSCVGLGCSLASAMSLSLGNCYPAMQKALFLASCEEMIVDVDSYTSCNPPSQSLSVKEHVLVVLRIKIGERNGYIVLDPGYHVGIPVIVMEDGEYPNTGWFVLSETAKSTKEYNYTMDGTYIQWHVKETRNGKTSDWTNLVYVGRKFLSCVQVSEKRNLVFNFRTIVARDRKQPIAGIYCNLEGDEKFTFFFNDGSSGRREVKIPFEYFEGTTRGDSCFENAISECSRQIGYNKVLVCELIGGMVEAFFNPDFMPHVLVLNRMIDEE